MAQPNVDKIAGHYVEILKELGADIQSEGMRETPMRAAKALVEMTEGSRMSDGSTHENVQGRMPGRALPTT